ncbi:MAG TPA: gliding motility-associated C-terminal domain-containing protein [Bacteroidales bacterium]|nr:gliding motility-associated C-terminal domain-containing protein [Bacteroidales bacterium]
MKLAGSSSGICFDVKPQQSLLKNIFLLFFLLLPVHAGSNSQAQNPVLPPVAVCRNITVQLGSSGTAVIDITDIDNGSHDPDGSIVTRSVFPKTFNCSQLGQNTVVLTVTDDEGLSSTCEAIVTVEDNTPPVINVKPFTLVLGSGGSASLSASDIDNGSYDNCGTVSLSVSPSFFTCSDLGEQTVVLTAIDENGNSASRNVKINVESTLSIAGMYLSSCDMSPTLALFDSDTEGGDGNYSYFWKGLDPESIPFMEIIPFPPSLEFSGTSTRKTPFFNNTMPNGYYGIRLLVTDGNGCIDSSEIFINKTSAIFNNQTNRNSEACEGEVRAYSVHHKTNADYTWSVTNGTILTGNQDTSRIQVRWDLGVVQGIVMTTIRVSNDLFPGNVCESTITDTVTITPIPSPLFANPKTVSCSNSEETYNLTESYAYHNWNVTGGIIAAGGSTFDNYVTVRWGDEQEGSIEVSVGHNSTCTGSVMLNVSISNLSGHLVSTEDIRCNGGSDGSATVIADTGKGQPPYAYSLDGGPYQPGGTFSGISLGNHYITIRDAASCTFNIPFVINQPEPLSVSVSDLTNVACFGENTGSVSVTAAGGVSPYTYRLDTGPFQDNGSFGSLSAGDYIITVRDANNCERQIQVEITQPEAALSGTVIATDVACYGDSTGSVDLSVTGGTLPYTFLWSNEAETEDISGVPAGSYSVTVSDSTGCTIHASASVEQPAEALTGNIVSLTHVSEHGESNGSITISGSGGRPPYSYSLDEGEFQPSGTFGSLSAGSYSIRVMDASSCIFIIPFVINQPDPLIISISGQTNVACFGENTGSVSVTATGGVSPYTYRLDTGPFQDNGSFGSLSAGDYIITVRDANNCERQIQVEITQPEAALSGTVIATDVACYGDSTGSVDLSVTGGTLPYTFLWSNEAETEDISGVPAGSYSVTISDLNGCTINASASVEQPAEALTGNVESVTNVLEHGGSNGSITVSGSGGTPPYSYSLDEGEFQPSGTFGSLSAGTYIILIRDAGMCLFELTVTVTQPKLPLAAMISDRSDISCNGANDGTVTVEGLGGSMPYLYSLEGGEFQSSGTFSGLTVGTYTITVRDDDLDQVDIVFDISQPDPLTVAVSGDDIKCYGGSTGRVTAIPSGGTEPYSYWWNSAPAQTTAVATGLPAGTYTVTVTDSNGCTVTNSVTISQPLTDMEISIEQENVTCNGGSDGSATAFVTGGLEPYSFSWNTDPEQTKENVSGLPAGTYTITVTDSYGCAKSHEVTIDEPLPITVNPNVTPCSCPDSEDGAIDLVIEGGNSPYIVLWSDGFEGQTRTGLAPGTYTAVISDNSSCNEAFTVELDFSFSSGCLVIPQVITPNNDGYNDLWQIRNIDLYPDAEVRIFNRWGKLIFSAKNLADNPWNGTIRGKPVPTDSYHYILDLKDGSKPRTGVISVIR